MSFQSPSHIETVLNNLIIHLQSTATKKSLYITLETINLKYNSITGQVTLQQILTQKGKRVTNKTFDKAVNGSIQALQTKGDALHNISVQEIKNNPNISMETLFRGTLSGILKEHSDAFKKTLIELLHNDYDLEESVITTTSSGYPGNTILFTPKEKPASVLKKSIEIRKKTRETNSK